VCKILGYHHGGTDNIRGLASALAAASKNAYLYSNFVVQGEMPKKEQTYYDSIKGLLLGRKIENVYYEELDYQNDEDYWRISESCHSIDMNVILELDNKEFIQIKWDNEFYCYGIGIEQLEKLDYREGIKTLTISQNKSWAELVNNRISAIKIYWDECQSSSTNYLPQSWEMQFENDKKIWISALEIKDDSSPSYWADHLTVLFSENEQEKYKLKKASIQHCVKMH
jgi:hypothetical protein